MRLRFRLLEFLGGLGLGLLSPVLTMALCAHGCTVENVGLAVSVFALTVLAAELPSGIFADLCGRKRAFRLAMALGAASAAALLLSRSFAAASASLLLHGLSAAFASGSLDALALEDAAERRGAAFAAGASASLLAWQCLGLLCGALLSAALPYRADYAPHLLARCAACLAAALASAALPEERGGGAKRSRPLGKHLRCVGALLRGSAPMRFALACVLLTALPQAVLETYWQPRLAALTGTGAPRLPGVLTASSYAAAALGSAGMGRLAPRREGGFRALWLLLGAIFALSAALLSLARRAAAFAALYAAGCFLTGMLSVCEQTAVSAASADGTRASALSAASLAARLGGALACAAGSAILRGGTIGAVWRAASAVSFAGLCALSLLQKNRAGR